jgi:hypothetical protein
MNWKNKYLKYKTKYINLKNKLGGSSGFTRTINVHYLKSPEILLNPIELDENDDEYTLKQQILNQVRQYNSDIIDNDIVLYRYSAASKKCTKFEMSRIENEICFDIKKSIDPSKMIPQKLESGYTNNRVILNEDGTFRLNNLTFIGRIDQGQIIDDENLILTKANGKLIVQIGDNEFIVYDGNFKKEIFEGKIDYPFKKEEGRFINGKLNGPGKLIIRNNLIWEGNFIDGEIIDGKQTSPDGFKYEGKFQGGLLVEGKLTKPDGRIEEGLFEDLILFQGKKNTIDGDILVGKFVDGILVNGKITSTNGHTAEGKFDRGLLIEGKLTTPEGLIEEGKFVNLKLVNGKRTNSDGMIEEGKFINGILVEGKETNSEGIIKEGIFNNGRLTNGKVIFSNNAYDEGKFVDGQFVEGKRIYSNGLIEEGKFIDGILISGKIIYSDGYIETI